MITFAASCLVSSLVYLTQIEIPCATLGGRLLDWGTRMIKKLTKLAAITALGLAAANPANAAQVFLNGPSSSGSPGNVRTFSVPNGSGTINGQVTGWSVNSSGLIQRASLGRWDGGLGVIYGSNDNSHTVDNSGRVDFVIFQFSQAIDLNRILLSAYGDTDATLRYGNVGGTWNANPGLHNTVFANLLARTPSSFGAPGGNSTGWRNVNVGNATANWWVISAASPNPDRYADYFKIKALDFTASAVPEPSTWMMMILGVGVIGATIRRRPLAMPAAAV